MILEKCFLHDREGGYMDRKKAILAVSFGTSHLDTLEKTIGAIERDMRQHFPECEVYRAFTSQTIVRKLRKENGIAVYSVKEVMEQMASDGIETVLVQPTHIINGIENDRMLEGLLEFTGHFQKIRIGRPLLSGPDDYKKVIHAIMSELKPPEDEALILVGHGTDHHANSAYPTLEYTFHLLGYQQVLIGTIGGFPSLQNVLAKLEVSDYRKVTLMPFLLVAGGHVKNDIAGIGAPWRKSLEETGYQVDVIMKGLGELKGIRNIFLEHIEEIM